MASLLTTIDPTTGQEITSYPVYDDKKIERAITLAQSAFEEWKRVSYADRAIVLKNIAKDLRRDKDYLAKIATYEMGKPIQQSRDEVEKCARALDFYAENGEQFLASEIVENGSPKSYVTFRPLGVVLAIMPWNFPYWQVFRAFAPIAMGGNTMVLKHASNVCACSLAIEKIVNNVPGAKGLLHSLLVPSSMVERLIDDPAIAAVTLTGSTEAGRQVASIAGRNLKKCVLELGGSDAYLILEDADIELAAEILVRGRLVNSGQSCVAAKRFIVAKSIRKIFEKAVTDRMKAATYGDPNNEDNKIGPMARPDLRDQLHDQVTKSIELGAKLLCGGVVPEMPGNFYPPTVLTHVKKGMPAYDEELFGPVAAIIEAKDEADAIKIANDSIYGLGGGIFSANIENAERLASEELEAGNCFVNEFVHSDPRLPFGGTKQSGMGRELGVYGIKEFVNIKTVFVK